MVTSTNRSIIRNNIKIIKEKVQQMTDENGDYYIFWTLKLI